MLHCSLLKWFLPNNSRFSLLLLKVLHSPEKRTSSCSLGSSLACSSKSSKTFLDTESSWSKKDFNDFRICYPSFILSFGFLIMKNIIQFLSLSWGCSSKYFWVTLLFFFIFLASCYYLFSIQFFSSIPILNCNSNTITHKL